LLGLAHSLREGRGACSAGDEPLSGAGLLWMPSLLIRRAEFSSLGTSTPQFGHLCFRSARFFGTQARQLWQNCVVPRGSTKIARLPSDCALNAALRANLFHDASEMDLARRWLRSIRETFSFSRTRTSFSVKIWWTSFFWKSSRWRLMCRWSPASLRPSSRRRLEALCFLEK